MITPAALSGQTGADSYTDLSSVNAIRSLKDKDQALEKIAQQFESMMMRMMLKSMRSANEGFSEGNFLSSHEGDTYRDMLDDQLALSLSQGKGMGIAEVMVRQLKGRFGEQQQVAATMDKSVSDYLANRQITVTPTPLHIQSPMPLVSKESAIKPSQTSASMEFDGSVEQFIGRLYPVAKKAAQALGVDPQLLLAQSALETGWGKKLTGQQNGDSSLNFFNIKADQRWQGDSVTVSTIEVRDGLPVRERAAFRSYSSAQHSFNDYVDFIRKSPRYEKALNSVGSENYIRSLKEAGYATDPDYADKVLSIMRSDDLNKAVSAAHNAMIKG